MPKVYNKSINANFYFHMNNYFAVFCIPAASMAAWMSKVPEAERKAQSDQMMKDWGAWMETNKSVIVDSGKPLGKTKRVSAKGIVDIKNDLNYYVILQAGSHDGAAAIIQSNPHVQIPDSFVDVMEIPHMGL